MKVKKADEHDLKLFKDIEKHLLGDAKPSVYLAGLADAIFCAYPFDMLGNLKKTPQPPLYHPEGSVWNHTLMVVDEAALRKPKSSDSRVFMWAALLHDLGKPATTRKHKGKITSYDHDKLGAQMAAKFLAEFEEDEAFIEKVSLLVRWHMQILFVVKALPCADIEQMQEQAPVFDIALLGLCDRLGRLGADQAKEIENIKIFLKKCRNFKN